MNNNNLTLIFSSVGHAFMHMFAAFYFVIILAIEDQWMISYDELIRLWTLGSLLVGIGALPAGWISDRWSRSMMMVIMFLGMGFSSIICGLSENKLFLFIGLSLLGLFCSIYHPVGVAWIVNSYKKRGKALGINGIFGGIGIGTGAYVAGLLVEVYGWQLAFIIPGVISIILSIILFFLIISKYISFRNISVKSFDEKHSSSQLILVAIILLTAMFGLGLTFQFMQTSLPKLFDLRIENISTYQIGAIVALIYGLSGLMSLIGGLLADKFSLKKIYLIGMIFQIPFFIFISFFTGIPLVIVCLLTVLFNASILPTENILLAKYTPRRHHGSMYGIKFIVAFGSGPLAVYLISLVYKLTSEFGMLFILSAIIMLIISIMTFFLPVTKYKTN
ncbi:MAG: hypothetical protein CFH19_00499 [Alphaproteobacteria bacterium MarineAlpha5_Bin9]|nr:MAG: hypothetical protein CFH19_00499 [Alphaproteobacteria bacterium MarineAlpha5_Bin9]